MPKQPPSIKFYEEESPKVSTDGESMLTRFIRMSSMGLIRTEEQASLVAFVILVLAGLFAYTFVQSQKPNAPTTTFEILPQESIGSSQGVPSALPYETR